MENFLATAMLETDLKMKKKKSVLNVTIPILYIFDSVIFYSCEKMKNSWSANLIVGWCKKKKKSQPKTG